MPEISVGAVGPTCRVGVGDACVLVHDAPLADPWDFRAKALASDFRDVPFANHVVFRGIAPCGHPEVLDWLRVHYPALTVTTTCFRRSPYRQVEPTLVHTDLDMGEWSGILYLNPAPPAQDGTTFFRDWDTRAIKSAAQTDAERIAEAQGWCDVNRWEPWLKVSAQFGRLILFPSSYFHARAIFDNYGDGEDARLILLLFGTGRLPGME